MSLIDSGEPELLKSESDSLVDENCFEARLFRLGAVFCALKQLGNDGSQGCLETHGCVGLKENFLVKLGVWIMRKMR